MEAVRKICDRGILLDRGGIILAGKTEDVIARYIQEGSDAKSLYTLPPPNPEENPPGYATKLVIEDSQGRASRSIPVGSPWQIRICFEIVRPVDHFIIALGLTTDMNSALRTSWSEPRNIAPGKYEAVFREE